ncbi:MAG: hypothetical protein ACI3X2_00080 [Butyricicoccus porcorum]
MSIIESIRQFLRTYEPLANGRLNIDFLPEEAQTYSVFQEPCESNLGHYITGKPKRQCIFVLASKEVHSSEIDQNSVNLEFYDDFASWMQEQNIAGNFPQLDRYEVTSIETTSPGYLYVNEINDTAQYRIQCRMLYE